MDIGIKVKERLLDLCRERKITINRLANISAVPPTTLKNIIYSISPNPGVITIKTLCDGLEITLFEFFNTKDLGDGKVLPKKSKSPVIKESKNNMQTIKTIKYRISMLCSEKNIPIYKLVDYTSVSTRTVNNILYGTSNNPKLGTIKKICDGLDITLAEFFDTDIFNNLNQEIK